MYAVGSAHSESHSDLAPLVITPALAIAPAERPSAAGAAREPRAHQRTPARYHRIDGEGGKRRHAVVGVGQLVRVRARARARVRVRVRVRVRAGAGVRVRVRVRVRARVRVRVRVGVGH